MLTNASNPTIEKLITAARTRIGTPWHHNQKTDGVGFDCLRFWQIVAKDVGIELNIEAGVFGMAQSNLRQLVVALALLLLFFVLLILQEIWMTMILGQSLIVIPPAEI